MRIGEALHRFAQKALKRSFALRNFLPTRLEIMLGKREVMHPMGPDRMVLVGCQLQQLIRLQRTLVRLW
jgi:hypothetical protein